MPAPSFLEDGSPHEPPELALDLPQPGPGHGLVLADIGKLPERSLLLFKGWRGFGASLVAARVPDAAIDAPKLVALPGVDIAGSAARIDIFDATGGVVEVPVRPPIDAGRSRDGDDPRPDRQHGGRRRSIGTVFKGFWHGPPLSLMHRVCLQSFIQHGHVFELYTYKDMDAGPGVVVKDANEILNKSEIFWLGTDIAPFSDLFRLKLLLDTGGWWCNVNAICVSDSAPDYTYAWARDNPETDPATVSNGLINCPKGDPIIKELYRRCNALRHVPVRTREHFGSIPMSELLMTRATFGYWRQR